MNALQVGSIVKFSDSQWGVYGRVSADDVFSELYGVSLLTAQYFARMFSTVRRDNQARNCLLSCLESPSTLGKNLEDLMQLWSVYHGTDGVTLTYDLSETVQENRECSFMLSYDTAGHFTPRFRPKGFGILGKYVEAASVGACLATADFYMQEYENPDYKQIVMETIEVAGSKLLVRNKLPIIEEIRIIREVVSEVFADKR